MKKRWAFVSDVARLYALVNYGGIYMDTDVEVLNSLDKYLNCEAFLGFESIDSVSTAIIASEKNQALMRELLEGYKGRHYVLDNGDLDLTTNVSVITKKCMDYGLILNNKRQTVQGVTIFPIDYFSPKDYKTLKISLTRNSSTIHHFDGSWQDQEDILTHKLSAQYQKFLPSKMANYIARFVALMKVKGVFYAIQSFVKWITK